MKNFRKSYLSVFMAFVFLFVSCNQYDTDVKYDTVTEVKTNKFDYALYNENKNNPILDEISKEIKKRASQLNKSMTKIQKNREILNIVNSKVDNKLNLPDAALELAELSSKEILSLSLKNKWMTLEDVTLTKYFLSDFKNNGIDLAISNFEKRVLEMNLSKEEFSKKNLFINTVMVMKYKNPNAFYKDFETNKNLLSKSSAEDEGILGCVLASIVLVGATIALGSCVTLFLCGLALFSWGYSFNNWMNKCVGQHSIM